MASSPGGLCDTHRWRLKTFKVPSECRLCRSDTEACWRGWHPVATGHCQQRQRWTAWEINTPGHHGADVSLIHMPMREIPWGRSEVRGGEALPGPHESSVTNSSNYHWWELILPEEEYWEIIESTSFRVSQACTLLNWKHFLSTCFMPQALL